MQVGIRPLQPKNKQPIYSLDVSPDGKLLALGQPSDKEGNAYLTLWSLEDFVLLREMETDPYGVINSVRFSPDGRTLTYAKNNGMVRFFDAEGEERHVPEFYDEEVEWLSYAFNRERLVICGEKTEVWDEDVGKVIWSLPDENNKTPRKSPALAALSPDGTRVAVASAEPGVINIYDVDKKELVQQLPGAPEKTRWISFNAQGNYLAVIERNANGTFLWDINTGQPQLSRRFNPKTGQYWSLSFHPDGQHIALGLLGDYVVIIRLQDGEYAFDQRVHKGRVWDLAFSRDGKRLVSGGDDGIAYVLDLK